MLAGGRWSRILAVLNTFCGALSSGLYRPLPAGSTTAFNNSPQSAGNCPKTLCNAGVPAGKKKLQRRALPARRRRYKAQMHLFSEFWDSLVGATNRSHALVFAFLDSLPRLAGCYQPFFRVRAGEGTVVGELMKVYSQ